MKNDKIIMKNEKINRFFEKTTADGTKNLIENKDVRSLEAKSRLVGLSSSEYSTLLTKGWLESKVQQACRNIILQHSKTIKKNQDIIFFQVDNGADLTFTGKIRKFREGTVSSMCDVFIYVFNGEELKIWGIEFKRVGSRSQIVGNKDHFSEQITMLERLGKMGVKAYMTNNIVFFQNVVLEEIKEFLNS